MVAVYGIPACAQGGERDLAVGMHHRLVGHRRHNDGQFCFAANECGRGVAGRYVRENPGYQVDLGQRGQVRRDGQLLAAAAGDEVPNRHRQARLGEPLRVGDADQQISHVSCLHDKDDVYIGDPHLDPDRPALILEVSWTISRCGSSRTCDHRRDRPLWTVCRPRIRRRSM